MPLPCPKQTLQELLVEGPLTNLKPSMVALSQPKRKFDRAAFGVGGVGAGGLGAIGRYHPPERVGEAPPAAAAPAAAGSGGGSGAAAGGNSLAAGHATLLPAAAGYSPFSGPSYSIPALPTPADVRGGRGSSRAPHGGSSASSQLDDGASQQGLRLGGLGGLGSMATQDSLGAFSQFGGGSLAVDGVNGGGFGASLGLGGLGDEPLSQASLGFDGFLTQAEVMASQQQQRVTKHDGS
jgi:hypothetical protein